jgi:two-component system, chemotaxis family, chemotaxis protein CheY
VNPINPETQPKVLIADDEIITREWLNLAMRRLSCEIIGSAADGAEAVQQYRQIRPDILVMDIEMPAKSGLEALRDILAEFPQAFVIVVSAHSTFDNVRQAIDLGAKGFVVKPFNLSKLADLVRKYRLEQVPTPSHPPTS